MSNSYTNLK